MSSTVDPGLAELLPSASCQADGEGEDVISPNRPGKGPEGAVADSQRL